MAIEVVGTVAGWNTRLNSGTASEHTVTLPAGLTAGDVVFTVFATSNGVPENPGGWEQVPSLAMSQFGTGLFWKVLDGTETTQKFRAINGSRPACSTATIVLRNVAGIDVYDRSARTTATTAYTVPSITPTVDNHLSIAFYSSYWNDGTKSTPLEWAREISVSQTNLLQNYIETRQYTGGAGTPTGSQSGAYSKTQYSHIWRLGLIPTAPSITAFRGWGIPAK